MMSVREAKQRLREWNRARRLQSRLGRQGTRLDYPQWIALYDTVTDEIREGLQARSRALPVRPLVSVLMPVYNPEPAWLREAIESVRGQIYEAWELCIADDCSTDPAVAAVLDEFAALDPRIKVRYRQSNGHISAASNTALELAEGAFTALFDHDDLLPPHALLCVAETVAQFPEVAVIYSDEDKIRDGERCEPYFKCDWNPDLFRSYNMISHLGVYRTALMRQVGGFRTGYEGAQDYDLALRCVEAVPAEQIIHIPHVLYHWRIHAASTAGGNAVKPYALEAGRRAIADHLARTGLDGEVQSHPSGWYKVRYHVPTPPPTLAVIVLDTGDVPALQRCISALSTHTFHANCEVVIVGMDEGRECPPFPCGRGTARRLAIPHATDLVDFANRAANSTQADVLVFVESDCTVTQDDWAEWLIAYALRPGTGAVGVKLAGNDGRLAGNGVLLGLQDGYGAFHAGLHVMDAGYFGRARLAQNLSAIGGGCIAIAREAFLRAGGFAAGYATLSGAAIDLSLRLRDAGLRQAWVPFVCLNITDAGRARLSAPGDRRLIEERWAAQLRNDPAYSPNLSLGRRSFDFAHPPRVSLRAPWFAPAPAGKP